MGKAKKRKPPRLPSKPYAISDRPKDVTKLSSKSLEAAKSAQQTPTIPFDADDKILLVGEGDFSFSRSLLEYHGCITLHATSYDTRSTVLSKYSQAASNTKTLEESDCKVGYGVDATKLGRPGGNGGTKQIKKSSWDAIVFNFPHVGGLTKDVNRQVRANQELLVSFFQSAIPLLSPNGRIIVTIFEGKPYDLWNIRDLARHVGLKVLRSFRFQASAYPGYKHARTLGNIKDGGGWKGEDRTARTYIFDSKDAQQITKQEERSTNKSDTESE